MQLHGNYILNISIGDTVTTVPPSMIRRLVIAQDICRLLPTFEMELIDATHGLAEIVPYDRSANSVQVEFCRIDRPSNLNTFNFKVKRRKSQFPTDNYHVEGVLDVPKALTDRSARVLSGDVKESLEDLAKDDFEIDETEIGASLTYTRDLIQPDGWTTGQFLQYLQHNLGGRTGEGGYCVFIKVIRGKPVLVFQSLDEIYLKPIEYKFIVGPSQVYRDFYPIGEYRVFDNSELISDMGAKHQSYSYYDWDTGTYKSDSVELDDVPCLSEFFLVDGTKDTDSVYITSTGRNNEFHKDFKGRIRNDFYLRISNLTHMWASTWGLENIAPGDIVQVMFGEALGQSNLFVYQHSGLWMVKRVVHTLGNTFFTNLLLVRAGIDTDISNSLVQATDRKRT